MISFWFLMGKVKRTSSKLLVLVMGHKYARWIWTIVHFQNVGKYFKKIHKCNNRDISKWHRNQLKQLLMAEVGTIYTAYKSGKYFTVEIFNHTNSVRRPRSTSTMASHINSTYPWYDAVKWHFHLCDLPHKIPQAQFQYEKNIIQFPIWGHSTT